jgi:predicted double-glycine peptidase
MAHKKLVLLIAAIVAVTLLSGVLYSAINLSSPQPNQFTILGTTKTVTSDRLIRVPMTRQATDHTCGVAALQSVLAYYGDSIREDTVGRYVNTTEDGTNKNNIAAYALSLGYNVSIRVNMTLDDLQGYIDSKTPVIIAIQAWEDPPVDWNSTWDAGHYVVAIGYDQDNFYFMDPSTLGNYAYIPTSEFQTRWHDIDFDGAKLIHFGIIITKPSSAYNPNDITPLG